MPNQQPYGQQIEWFWHGILEDAVTYIDKPTCMKQENKECEHLMPDPFTVDEMINLLAPEFYI